MTWVTLFSQRKLLQLNAKFFSLIKILTMGLLWIIFAVFEKERPCSSSDRQTCDGTNDAPALKEADIGISMGVQGTEVAKESLDIVILDDNFSSVATVLRWGRCVHNNIQKFRQFQLIVNVAALVINLIATVSASEVPLTTVQLLWVNLIMDTLGALALATDRPTRELMEKTEEACWSN